MSILDLAVADAAALLSLDGDDVVLTAPASLNSSIYLVRGQFVRRGVSHDAEGLTVIADTAAVTVSLFEIMDKGLADPEQLKLKGWTVEVRGGRFLAEPALLDRTIGVATMILKKAA